VQPRAPGARATEGCRPGSPPEWGSVTFLTLERTSERFDINLLDTKDLAVTATTEIGELSFGRRLFHGDFDGDGNPDVAVSTAWDVIHAFRRPDLAPLGTIPAETQDGTVKWHDPVVTFDIDRDGRDEIIAQTGYGVLEVWKWSGAWSLVGELLSSSCLTAGLSRGDLDGDGHLELLAYPTESCYRDRELDVLQVYHGAPGATTVEPQKFPIGIYGYHLIVGDYDGDGRDDVMVVRDWENIALMLSRPDGSLPPASLHSLGEPIHAPYNFEPGFAFSGDVDGDGDDEVLAMIYPTIIMIDFVEGELVYTDLRRYELVLGADDVNHDGRIDILTVSGEGYFLYLSTT
jgi:hypothetical protein